MARDWAHGWRVGVLKREGRGPSLSCLRRGAWDGWLAGLAGLWQPWVPRIGTTSREITVQQSIVEPDRAVELSVGGVPRLPLWPARPIQSNGSPAHAVQSGSAQPISAQLSPNQMFSLGEVKSV